MDGLQKRTKLFSLRIIKFVQELPSKKVYWVIGDQLLRSGTSVGANTRASYRARSTKEFISKSNIVIEEADESQFWLELLEEGKLCPPALMEELQWLKKEADQLTAIFVSIQKKQKKQ